MKDFAKVMNAPAFQAIWEQSAKSYDFIARIVSVYKEMSKDSDNQ